MQIRQQIFNLLIAHYLIEAFHFRSPILNDVEHAVIVGGQSAEGKIGMFEYALQTWTLFAAGRVRLVTAITIIIVEPPSVGLLRIEPKFGVGLPPLNVTAAECENGDREQENWKPPRHPIE